MPVPLPHDVIVLFALMLVNATLKECISTVRILIDQRRMSMVAWNALCVGYYGLAGQALWRAW